MAIARLWHTQIDAERADEYEAFARNISLPMFERQEGYRGVLMFRDGADCTVLTLWHSQDAVTMLDRSASYQATVEQIKKTGFLREPQSVKVTDLHLIHFADAFALDTSMSRI